MNVRAGATRMDPPVEPEDDGRSDLSFRLAERLGARFCLGALHGLRVCDCAADPLCEDCRAVAAILDHPETDTEGTDA